jgi:DNA topoisomerase-1
MDHKLYLSDPGIYKKGNKFYFNKKSHEPSGSEKNNEEVTDQRILQRISKYVVPPAWKNVWYASKPRCHIQVCGTDSGGKKQYILSEQWVKNSKYVKYNRMKSFIRDLSIFKKRIKLKNVVLSRETLIHLLFNLLIDLHIRVGNEIYAQQNGSYGLTTLRQKHLKDNKLVFLGKSNINHKIDIPEEYVPWFNLLKIENAKNKPLFYYHENNRMVTVSSEELNVYLKTFMGKEYTCKDFRTYSANMLFIKSFKSKSVSHGNSLKPKRIVLMSIDESAQQLGHTRSISRKSYISETLIDYCVHSFDEASRLSSSDLLSKIT